MWNQTQRLCQHTTAKIYPISSSFRFAARKTTLREPVRFRVAFRVTSSGISENKHSGRPCCSFSSDCRHPDTADAFFSLSILGEEQKNSIAYQYFHFWIPSTWKQISLGLARFPSSSETPHLISPGMDHPIKDVKDPRIHVRRRFRVESGM